MSFGREKHVTVLFEDGTKVLAQVTNAKYYGEETVELRVAYLESSVQETGGCFP